MVAVTKEEAGTVTPLEIWPTRVFSGRAGYSGRHYAAVANGGADSPLLVAQRLADRRLAPEQRFAHWDLLCRDLSAVIRELEKLADEPGIKPMLKQALAAQRRFGATVVWR